MEYNHVCSIGNFEFRNSADLVDEPLFFEDLSIHTTPVKHVESSYAVIFQSSKFKVVYSGDTRPSSALVNAGRSCDLLIHEGTFDNQSSADAVKKMHSTWKEAISISSQ
jgi:ribonuclease Z